MPDGRSKRLSGLFAFLRPRKAKGGTSLPSPSRPLLTRSEKPSVVGSDAASLSAQDTVSSRSRTATPSPRPTPSAPATSALPSDSHPPPPPSSGDTLAPPPAIGAGHPGGSVYDPSRQVSSATFGSRMSGLNEVYVANFPLPPNHHLPSSGTARSSTSSGSSAATPTATSPSPSAVPADVAKAPARSESTPVFSLGDELPDLTLSNPSQRPQPARASTTTAQSPRSSLSPKARDGFLRRASSVGLRLAGQAMERSDSNRSSVIKSRPQSLLPPPQIPQIDLKFDVGRMDVDFNPAKPARSTTTL